MFPDDEMNGLKYLQEKVLTLDMLVCDSWKTLVQIKPVIQDELY